jgi:hypothetical protein
MRDGDGDGWGSNFESSFYNYTVGTDCDDYEEMTYPGVAYIDSTTECMTDEDGDGYGSEIVFQDDITEGTDCNDSDADANPGTDADADGFSICTDCDDDDSAIGESWMGYVDADFDGYGNIDTEGLICSWDVDEDGVNDYSDNGDDCDDTDANINPSVDGDSDGADVCLDCDDTDSNVGAVSNWYIDNDGDGYGNFSAIEACTADYYGDGSLIMTDISGDCDDSEILTYPGAAELDSTTTCLADLDEDGYGEEGSCFNITQVDSYGDGWDSSTVDVYIDGNLESSIGLDDGAFDVTYWCGFGSTIEIGYTDGSNWGYEIGFILYDNDGVELYNSGYDPASVDIANGDTPMYSGTMTISGGSDVDDGDAGTW